MINGKVYIGQSNNVSKRINEHLWALRNNKHKNSHLQYSWNKYGEANFKISILEECELSKLSEREIYYIKYYDSYKNGYNNTLGGEGSSLLTIDVVKPICDLFNTGKYSTNELADYFHMERKRICRYLYFGNINNLCNYDPIKSGNKKVICLTDNKIFESIKEAEDYYNINGVASCCKHKHDYSGRNKNGKILIWMYLNEYETYSKEEIDEYICNIFNKHDKRVVCLNNQKIFKDLKDACCWANLKNYQSISECCLLKKAFSGQDQNTGEKYVWAYYRDYITLSQEEIEERVKQAQTYSFEKAVVCINTGEKYDSAKIASIFYNCNREDIKKCCRGSVAYAGFDKNDCPLTWCYEEDYNIMSSDDIKNKKYYCQIMHIPDSKEKKVICMNNHYVFQNQTEAGKWCGLKNPSQIGYGIRNNKKYIGKHPDNNEKLSWMYFDDYKKVYPLANDIVDYNCVLQYE